MCSHHLDGQVDIHGGGTDLIFPHHENEIAQSEAFLGVEPFSRYWLHNGMLQLGGDKMSKSIGNVIRIKDLIEGDQTQAFRLMVLQSHYRAPLDLYGGVTGRGRTRSRTPDHRGPPGRSSVGSAEARPGVELAAQACVGRVSRGDERRLQQPGGCGGFVRSCSRRSIAPAMPAPMQRKSKSADRCLSTWPQYSVSTWKPERIPSVTRPRTSILLVEVRDLLRAEKQWALSDLIRDRLAEKGIAIADGSSGSTWQKS